MEKQNNKVRAFFSVRANLALDNIVKIFKLKESAEESVKKLTAGKPSNEVVIDRLSKNFAVGSLSEKELSISLQKDLEVSPQIAEQISKEIITKIIPFLEKVPEEKLQDPVFVEQLSKKIFGETAANSANLSSLPKIEVKKDEDMDMFPKIKPQQDIVAEPTEDKFIPAPKRIKKPMLTEKPKDSTPKTNQPKGPDSYREPIN